VLGYRPFYHQTMRKVLIAFGSLFNGLEMVKYANEESREELGRITVPVTYEGKETFITRLEADPDLTAGVQIILPAMTYEMTGIKYDPQRKITQFIKNQLIQTSNSAIRFTPPVPYNMGIDVNLYVRNMEDGLQLIEQIIPFFATDYTVGVKYVMQDDNYISYDLPFILEDIQFNNEYEGPAGAVRKIVWTLNFNAKLWLFGPMPSTGIIKNVIVDIRDQNTANTLAEIDVRVNPITANVGDTYTIDTTITEIGG
jgi:hypothetical protein